LSDRDPAPRGSFILVVLRRLLAVLCAAAAVWAAAVALTGGFRFHLGSIRVSSRGVWNPLAIASLGAVAVWALSARLGDRGTLREEWSWWKRLGSTVPALFTRQLQRYQNVAAALLIGLIVMALNIYQWQGGLPFWLDEETIAINVRDRSFAELAGSLWLGQSAPFGWLVLQRAALLTLGTGEPAARFVPLLFAIATLAGALWIGRRWMGPAGAAVLMLLCSIGQWFSHYPQEVKHYTSDIFWALLLPALAVWAIEAEASERTRRTAIWWLAAAAGLWLSNGAVLVTPACALFLFAARWRRDGRRAALEVALFGCLWLASFGGHYQVSGRATLNNPYLREYWAGQFPPARLGLIDIVRWVLDRFEPLAFNPGGTVLWVSFWLCAAAGMAWNRRRALGLVFATAPLSAFAFAGLRLVPLYERLSLWIVPAMYVGVALMVDGAVRLGRDAYRRRQWVQLTLAALLGAAEVRLCADIISRGWGNLKLEHAYGSKHGLDDRAAVRWLMPQRQPGDAIMTTRLAWPAIWWYGDIPIGNAETAAGRLPDGSVMYEVAHVDPGAGCRQNHLRAALKNHRRALVYFGFQDVPPGFADLLLHGLEELGTVSSYRQFAALARVAVIDLQVPGSVDVTPRLPGAADPTVTLRGCVGVELARRW
jgi:hypothetical protein